MSGTTLHLKKPDLTGFEELLLLTGRNPMTLLYVGYRPDTGFDGGLVVNPKRDPLVDCAADIDRAATKGGRPPFRPIAVGIPPLLLSRALLGPEDPEGTGYAADQLAALSRMIRGRMPEGGLSYLTRAVLRITDERRAPLIDQVNFLSCGDRGARLQALRAVPLHAVPILNDPAFRDLIDQRAPLTPLIAERSGLAPAEMRRYAQIEARMATIMARALDGAEPLTRQPAVKPGGYMFGPIIRQDTETLRHLALNAAKRLRADQVPSTPEDTVEMLTYVSEAERLRSLLTLAEGPFRRHMSRVPPAAAGEGAWAPPCAHLQGHLPERETSDYLRSLSTALVTGLLISRLRDRPEVDFDRFGRAALALREKREPEVADAAPLGVYVQELSSGDHRMSPIRAEMTRLIGEGHSIKSLREAQVRWHHVRQAFENEVMTSRDPLSWSPLLGELDLDGVRAVELTSSAALDRQGRLERHCVGAYTGTVMGATSERASLIFSLERGERILSTIELVVTRNSWDPKNISWKISQNKAAGNAEPDDLALKAGMRLRDALADLPKRRVRDYLTGIRTNATQIRDQLALATTRCGGDVVNPDLPERVLAAYAEVLPKRLRGLDPAGLMGELSRVAGPNVVERIDAIADRIVKALPEPEPATDAPDQTGFQMAS
jgi:hypothetical protein